ncbi:MAG: hypothetical protein WA060_00775 [Minisyncoccia bacterium]
MTVGKTRKENPFLKKPEQKRKEDVVTELRRVPSLRPPKWHPVLRKERSLFSELAEVLGEDLRSYDEECREHDLKIMRRIF